MQSVEELSSTCTQLSPEYLLQKALEQEQAEALGPTGYERLVDMRSEHEAIEALLCSAGTAIVGAGSRCHVLRKRHPCRFGLTPLRTAMKGMSKGDCIAYAITLNVPAVARLVTFVTLPLHLWRVERTIARDGSQIVGRYGVDPSLDTPSCVYELSSPAAEYADRYLRPRGAAQVLRRALTRWFTCDPTLGGVIIVGRKA